MLNVAQLLRWFFSNFTVAVLVDKNKIFLRCELNSLSCTVCKKNCVGGRLVTWLHTVNLIHC